MLSRRQYHTDAEVPPVNVRPRADSRCCSLVRRACTSRRACGVQSLDSSNYDGCKVVDVVWCGHFRARSWCVAADAALIGCWGNTATTWVAVVWSVVSTTNQPTVGCGEVSKILSRVKQRRRRRRRQQQQQQQQQLAALLFLRDGGTLNIKWRFPHNPLHAVRRV